MTPELTERARAVLYALLTEYLATGEPVGSRTLSRRYGLELSAATIRNVMADLEEAGLLAQPHTSAGRTPTAPALRVFVDALMQRRPLSADDQQLIRGRLAELGPDTDLVREGGRLLSDMTASASVYMRPPVGSRSLRKAHFIATRPGELLGVLVLGDGTVENRYVRCDPAPSTDELERLNRLLDEVAPGQTLEAVRDAAASLAAGHTGELRRLQLLGQELLEGALRSASSARTEVVVDGHERLLARPEFSSAEKVRQLVHTLEDTERLLHLLDRTVAARNVHVFLPDETSDGGGAGVSLVAAPYGTGRGGASGAVGVLGPELMDYPKVVPLVDATAHAMADALAARERPPGGRGDDRGPASERGPG